MCKVKTPKPKTTEPEKKPVQYLSNPWLDGLGIVGAGTRGRNSLRLDPGVERRPVTPLPQELPAGQPQAPQAQTPTGPGQTWASRAASLGYGVVRRQAAQ